MTHRQDFKYLRRPRTKYKLKKLAELGDVICTAITATPVNLNRVRRPRVSRNQNVPCQSACRRSKQDLHNMSSSKRATLRPKLTSLLRMLFVLTGDASVLIFGNELIGTLPLVVCSACV
jgi:hypothetical protein